MEALIALLVGGTVLLVGDRLRRLPAGYFGRRTQAAYEPAPAETLPWYRLGLQRFAPVARFTPTGWARALGQQLYWAQLDGKWPGWSLTEMVALHLAAGLAGLLLGLLLAPTEVTLILALALTGPFLLNLLTLRSPARRVHRQVQAELPELVTLLAAEVAAATTLEEALVRLSHGGGFGAVWIRQALTGAVGAAVFTQGGQPGALLAQAEASGDDDLIALAINLDKIKQRGTGVQELLAQTARAAAARYIAEAHIRAEKVGSEIILPMVAFFFLPYVVVLLMVLGAPLLSGALMP